MSKAIFIVLAGICLVSAAQVSAQSTLEEVVVTAQKREESLMDVPLSITVFSGKSLEQDGISNLQDIGSQTPGLVFSAFSVGQPEISIRGISTKEDGASANDSTVVSIDDVYIAARTAQVFDIFDLERVEILRGPQGTLYGKNSIGGSINFVTLKPTQEKVVRIQQSFGNYERLDTGLLVSGGLHDDLAAKFSFSRRSHGGYLTNLLNGEDQGESETYAWRTQAVWTPRNDVEFIATLDGAIDHLGATNREPIGSSGPLHDCGCASDPMAVNAALGGAGDAFTTLAETEGYMERDVFGASLKASWDFSEKVSLVSITAYRQSDFDWREDSEGLPPSNVFINLAAGPAVFGPLLVGTPAADGFTFDVTNFATEETEQFTQEIRLLSTGDDRLSWLGGFFYSTEDIKRTESYNFPSLAIGPEGDYERSIQHNDTTSWAFYGQAQYDIMEQLTATLGLRYSSEDKEANVGAEILNGNPAAVLLAGAPFPDSNGDGIRDGLANAEVEFENFSWRIALDYALNDAVTLFTNIATGFKSGGFSGSPSTELVGTTPFNEEEAISYEFGIKSRLMDNRVMLNASGFIVDYDDLQVTRFFQPVGSAFGEFITENAGKAEISGLEIEVIALPAEGVEIGGSYAWLDAKFENFLGSPSIAGDGTIIDPGNFNGNRLRIAPENTASAYLFLEHGLSHGGMLSGKFKIRYQDDMFFDPDENPINVSDAYTIMDAWAAYTTPDERWEVKFWIKNIGDEEYVTHGFTQRGGRIAFGLFGEPRTFGGTVTFNY
jgi:iron complex outermembrane receptor protein